MAKHKLNLKTNKNFYGYYTIKIPEKYALQMKIMAKMVVCLTCSFTNLGTENDRKVLSECKILIFFFLHRNGAQV